ncbi:glutathione S-transferase family protein [Pseudolysobacter antarcticus]|uniref:Glutathione S-transferase family protein n=1 Tax=Pseudolysobacter antarcticus TaxID=2511995 RepID=A0A411HHM3_9GAMM|nr:glutathione S-transferase family protein [Pseudolysobacter antarcticus]QBB69981.1 glutathione S-transferase family protein [Pseudolysobacter antarcticus]
MPTLKLYDYLPSQNAWKIRVLLAQLGLPYQQVLVSIFEGQGQTPEFLAMKSSGGVPVLEIAPGEYLAESNAILAYLAEGSRYLSMDRLQRARTFAWLFFESEMVEPNIGSLRFWTLTDKLAKRDPALIAMKRAGGTRALASMQRHLQDRKFFVDERCSIADISLYAYTHLAADAGFDFAVYPAVDAWIKRVREQPGLDERVYPYSIDPHSFKELRERLFRARRMYVIGPDSRR